MTQGHAFSPLLVHDHRVISRFTTVKSPLPEANLGRTFATRVPGPIHSHRPKINDNSHNIHIAIGFSLAMVDAVKILANDKVPEEANVMSSRVALSTTHFN